MPFIHDVLDKYFITHNPEQSHSAVVYGRSSSFARKWLYVHRLVPLTFLVEIFSSFFHSKWYVVCLWVQP